MYLISLHVLVRYFRIKDHYYSHNSAHSLYTECEAGEEGYQFLRQKSKIIIRSDCMYQTCLSVPLCAYPNVFLFHPSNLRYVADLFPNKTQRQKYSLDFIQNANIHAEN